MRPHFPRRFQRIRVATVVAVAIVLAVALPAYAAPPTNDNFDSAVVAAEAPFSHSVATSEATDELGEPSPCGGISKTVWYRFTPSEAVTVVADTRGSNFDTVLAVYTGDSVATLAEVACDDDSGENLTSMLSFDASPGVTYHFQAGGYFGDTGDLVFNLGVTPVPRGCLPGIRCHVEVDAQVTTRVDIKPGSHPNSINLSNEGVVPVALLGGEGDGPTLSGSVACGIPGDCTITVTVRGEIVDAGDVDPKTVCFGDAENPAERDCTEAHGKGHLEDANGDARDDLVLHYETLDTGIDAGDTQACLTGVARFEVPVDLLGQEVLVPVAVPVEGCDSIQTL